jgi:hypothetical protein
VKGFLTYPHAFKLLLFFSFNLNLKTYIMAAILEKIAKLAIPAGLAVGGIQSAMYDGKFFLN